MASPGGFCVRSERHGMVHSLTPVGELDVATTPLLAREFDTVQADDAETIIVDLSELTFIDSSGLQLLIRMDCACAGEQRLRIITGSAAVDRLLKLAGMREHLPIVSNL